MEQPRFNIDDVKYAEDSAMFARAQALYEKGKVTQVEEILPGHGYCAVVHGSEPYTVSVSNKRVDQGDCTCYMGKNEMLCKHMLALALSVLNQTGKEEEAPPANLKEAKLCVDAAMRKLRAYTGPSRVWFSYQRTLSIGAGMTVDAVSNLSASKEHADYIWKIVLRISKKLATGGIDDSEGVVGDCVYRLIEQLGAYAEQNSELKAHMRMRYTDDTGFGFEDDLQKLL